MSKVTPFLWFDHHAEEAANFYVSLFPNSRVLAVEHWPDGSPFPKGSAQSVIFELDGRKFLAIDAGPKFKFSEALSMFVDCRDQEEVDRLWEELTADGGEESMCGWLKDRFGLSWQIIPAGLQEALGHSDPVKAGKASRAMYKMRKINMAEIERAMNA